MAAAHHNRTATLTARHARARVAIVRKMPVHTTVGAGMRTEVRMATEIPMETGLNTRDIPITGATNALVRNPELRTRPCNNFGLATEPAQMGSTHNPQMPSWLFLSLCLLANSRFG